MTLKKILIAFVCFQFSFVQAQVIWHADPSSSTNPNDFFRRFDSGNYPADFCYTSGDQNGVTASKVSTPNDSQYGKVWKINKPKNRKRGEFARAEGDKDYYKPKVGDDIYIGWRWKIGTENNTSINNEVAVWQWKAEGAHNQNYPVNLEYDGDLTLNAFGPDWYGGSFPSNRRAIIWRKAVPQDTWVTIVVRIKVSKSDKGAKDGFVEFWFNGVKQKLGTGTNNNYKVDLSSDKYKAYHRTYDGTGVYPKWGVYNKNSCSYNASAYFDELKIGSSLTSVLPSGSNVANKPPTVNMTSPSNGAVFNVGEKIDLKATASDTDGNVDKVNFKLNGVYYSQDNDGPAYTGTFTPTSPGTYKLSARAFDDDNAQTENEVTITVVSANNLPTVNMTSPSNGSTFDLGETINLSATANDDGSVDYVNFKVNDAYYSQDKIGPAYTSAFTPTTPGIYKLSAKAFDNTGLTKEVAINITVVQPNRPPSGYFVNPAFDEIEEDYEKLYVRVQDTDIDGDSVDITLYIDDVLIRQEKSGVFEWGHITNAGDDFTDETLNLEPGMHTLKAVILDERGLTATITKDLLVKEKFVTSISGKESSNIFVFPNPSKSGVFHLNESKDWKVYELQGGLILEGASETVDLSSFANGVYLIKANGNVVRLILH